MAQLNCKNVRSGEFSHKKCDQCQQEGSGLKVPLTDELLTITRVCYCASLDDAPVSFSLMVMGKHRLSKKFAHIVRACSSHANYHWHLWTYLRPAKEASKQDLKPLNSVEDVTMALRHASIEIVERAFEWEDQWLPRKR